MTKALIFGTGAVGSVYGYILTSAGVQVTAICRSNYSTIKENGITIRSGLWGQVHYQPLPVQTVSEANAHGPFDYILVCSKSFPGLAAQIQEAVTSDTAIVLAQNGIAIEEEYHQMYPDNTLISGVVWLPTTQTAPGVVDMGSMERLEIGTFPASAPASHKAKAVQLSELWSKGGGNAPLFEDIQGPRWSKLAINCAFNPMSALSRCGGANLLLSSPEADDMVVTILRQIGTVAKAAGYDCVTEESIQAKMQIHRGRMQTGGKEPSMLVDAKAGRPMEVDAILGNTVAIARKFGVDVPHLELLYMLTRALDFSIVKPVGRWKEVNYST